METKKEIRSFVLKQRQSLSEDEVEEKSRLIYESVIAHSWFLKAQVILVYMDYNKEVQTRYLIEKAWELGKTVCVPKVCGNIMEFYRILSFDELEKRTMGIMEPKEGCYMLNFEKDKIKPEDVLAIMPGVAFDRDRNRIGYGGGYYDRYFEKKEKIKKLAVAFEIQMVPHIQAEPFDLKPDCLLTEKQLYCPD